MEEETKPGEFTAYCTHYYQLTVLLAKRRARLQTLLDNAPLYNGETNLSDIDAIIAYYRHVQARNEKMETTQYELAQTGRTIIMIMQHFAIPPGTVLTGIIPNELEYEIYADENDELYITKTKELDPEANNPNIIEIKVWCADDGEEED